MPQTQKYPLQRNAWGPERDKAKELILYVSLKSKEDKRFGDTKLNKILFYSEALSLVRLGRPITGHSFQRNKYGPTLRALLHLRREMEQDGACRMESADYHGNQQQRTVPLRKPKGGVLSEQELQIVDEVIRALWDHDAKGASDLSHNLAWEMIPMKKDVPLETIFFSDSKLTEEEVKYARELAAKRRPPRRG